MDSGSPLPPYSPPNQASNCQGDPIGQCKNEKRRKGHQSDKIRLNLPRSTSGTYHRGCGALAPPATRSGGLGGKSSAGLSNGDNGAAPAPSRLSRHAAASVALASLSLIARDLVARLAVVALPQPLAALASSPPWRWRLPVARLFPPRRGQARRGRRCAGRCCRRSPRACCRCAPCPSAMSSRSLTVSRAANM